MNKEDKCNYCGSSAEFYWKRKMICNSKECKTQAEAEFVPIGNGLSYGIQ